MRSRNGQPLALRLLTPSSSANRAKFAVLIQAQLRDVGAKVEVESVDGGAFGARLKARTFDANMGGTHTTPSPSGLRQTWSSAASTSSAVFNAGRYASAAFDAHVDSAIAAVNPTQAKAHYQAAYQLILDDAPAAFLYSPATVAGANKRLIIRPLRADAWWVGLATWSIAPRAPRPPAAAPVAPEHSTPGAGVTQPARHRIPGDPPGSPRTVTVPPAMSCPPTIARSSVVLPPPLGPSRPTTCPRGTDSEIPGSTSREPLMTRRPSTATTGTCSFIMW